MEDKFLEEIYERQALVHKVCRIYRDSKEDREDLFQEIIYQLWKAYPNFKGEAKISTWMYRISLNTAMASFRKPKLKISEAPIPENLPAQDTGPEEAQQELLFAAIRKLDDAEKAVIALYLEDMSYTEMAGIVGISENYIGVRLNRIKKKIKELLNV